MNEYNFIGDDLMNCKIPFTKDILFEKKVCEITSISLEHELISTEDDLKGNFIISGDFKSHEVSVNKEAFSYILPFEIELADDIDRDTIEFMIDDFTYEIIDNSTLRVNIDFNVIASLKEIEEVEEPLFKDARELFLDESEEIELVDDRNNTLENLEEKIKANDTTEDVKENEKISEDTIINSLENTNNEYTTYHIHMVSDGETVETICTMYNSNMSILSEYNNLSELSAGDKLIIPESNE